MKKLMLVSALLGVAMTSCGWLSKLVPEKTHSMDYIVNGYCENPKLVNKSAVDLYVSRGIRYQNSISFILKPNEVLDSSGISLEIGNRIEYDISWMDWKQGDIIKYDLRCSDTFEPLKIEISYDNYKRQRLYVYESKEDKTTGLDAIWRDLH